MVNKTNKSIQKQNKQQTNNRRETLPKNFLNEYLIEWDKLK